MKIRLLSISIILLAFACQNAPKETSIDQPKEPIVKVEMINVQKVELAIDGMTCTGCEKAIQKTINDFEGVYASKANHENGTAVFEFDSTKIDILKVEAAINELGYEAKGHTVLTE
ncbi:MAG: heavy-metal-associated domain-containing protein [Bacteroidales bacterium]|nr:heavy-metal-associated domain-containing protein [Bacteroidales bacterium]